MVRLAITSLLGLALLGLPGYAAEAGLERDPFLKPYVTHLKNDTPAATLTRITAMRREDLILLHHGYGTGIRNKWLWGNRDAALLGFFRTHGLTHPDDMSMVLIHALWDDLNSNLTPAERSRVEEHRREVVARRETYRRLADECTSQVVAARAQFEKCFRRHGPPAKNPNVREPFFSMVVAPSGKVAEIGHWEGGNKAVRSCLGSALSSFVFSPLGTAGRATLHTSPEYRCSVAEQLDAY